MAASFPDAKYRPLSPPRNGRGWQSHIPGLLVGLVCGFLCSLALSPSTLGGSSTTPDFVGAAAIEARGAQPRAGTAGTVAAAPAGGANAGGANAGAAQQPASAATAGAWAQIWEAKGMDRVGLPLHVVDGFDMLSEAQWSKLVARLTADLPVPRAAKMFELGCGAGAFVVEMQRKYPDATVSGVDFSTTLATIGNWRTQGVFLRADIRNLAGFLDATFDVTLMFSVLFYLSSYADATRALEEMLRVTMPGGSMFVGDVSDLDKKQFALDLRKQTHKDQKKRLVDPGHLYYPKSFFRDFARKHGLSVKIVPEEGMTDITSFYANARYRYSVIFIKPASTNERFTTARGLYSPISANAKAPVLAPPAAASE
jgi:ubiquinone/menaquinone biosynthesis C-methylase UbiE